MDGRRCAHSDIVLTYTNMTVSFEKVCYFMLLASFNAFISFYVGIQQENSAIRSLQQENDDLRQNLTDHQSALELIMTKYRHQMVQFMNKKK